MSFVHDAVSSSSLTSAFGENGQLRDVVAVGVVVVVVAVVVVVVVVVVAVVVVVQRFPNRKVDGHF